MRGETLDDASLLVHKKFGEIPLDGVAEQPAFFVFQELVKWVRVVAVDLNFRKQREIDAVIHIAERLDFVVVAGLLVAELIAREAENFEAAVVVSGVELLQSLVLRGEAALAGGVDDEQDLAFVGGERTVGCRCSVWRRSRRWTCWRSLALKRSPSRGSVVG